jgi:hypothetical protein
MLQLIKKINIYIRSLYFYYLLWVDSRKAKKHLKKHPQPVIMYNRVQAQYEEGLKSIKKHINSLVQTNNKEEYDLVLKNIDNLLLFSRKQSEPEYLKAMEKAWIYKDKDVKSSLDKAKMIEKRIIDFEELKRHKEKREAIRRLRNLKKED